MSGYCDWCKGNDGGVMACNRCIEKQIAPFSQAEVEHRGCRARLAAAEAQRDEALALLRDLREAVDLTESALRNMGSEELHNMSTPQTVRDLCRHHADLLAKALRGGA